MKQKFEKEILIPGPWKSKENLSLMLSQQGKYYLNDIALVELKTKKLFFSYLISDAKILKKYYQYFLPSSMEYAENKIYSPIRAILVIRDIEEGGGSLQQKEQLCNAITEILKNGGYGVKILNSGKFLSHREWEKYSFEPETIFKIFVSVYELNSGLLTCGMSNFGKRDIFIPLASNEDGMNTAVTFAWYIIAEQPEFKDRDTFSVSKNAPIFKVFETEDDMRELEHPFYNPYGLWKLLSKDQSND